jgi:hypothetical protein
LEPAAAKLNRELIKDSYTAPNSAEVSAANILTRRLRLPHVTSVFINADDNAAAKFVTKAKPDVLTDIIETAQEDGQNS